jgi:hypothetical protein
MVSTNLNIDLLNKVQNVQVSDTTGDAMKYKSSLQKNIQHQCTPSLSQTGNHPVEH